MFSQGKGFYDYIPGRRENVPSGTNVYFLPVLAICPSGKRYDDDETHSTNPDFSYGYNAALSDYGNVSLKLDMIRDTDRRNIPKPAVTRAGPGTGKK